MLGDPLLKVKSGLGKGLWIAAIFITAVLASALVRFYFEYVVRPPFSVLWFYALSAFVIGDDAVAIWFLLYRYKPRILRFVESLTGRLRESDYAAWGRQAGLRLVFDNGLLLSVSRNLIGLRLFLDHGGTVLHPTLQEWPLLLRSYRRAKRTVHVRSRKGRSSQSSELARVLGLIGGRWATLSLLERVTPETFDASGGRWNVVGVFFIPKWWQCGNAFRNALDDIEKLLESLTTSPSTVTPNLSGVR